MEIAPVNAKRLREITLSLKKLKAYKSGLSILSNVKIDFCEGSIKLSVTDLDNQIVAELPSEGEVSGSVIVDLRKLNKIALKFKKLDNKTGLRINDDGNLEITAGDCKFTILSKSHVEDWPTVFEDLGEVIENETVKTDNLQHVFDRTEHCISTDDARANLCGLYFHSEEQRVIATDGHRMAVQPLECNIRDFILPKKAVEVGEYLMRTKSSAGMASMTVRSLNNDETKVMEIRFEKFTIRSIEIEGTFPDYTQVLPEQPETLAESSIEPEEALGKIEAIKVALNNQTNGIKLDANGTLDAVAEDPGEATAEVTLTEEVQGDNVVCGINAKYLKQCLKKLSKPSEVRMIDELSPVMFSEYGEDGFEVIMPLRL